jgi:nicotinate-nucleotide adenylyltransferase
MDEQKEINEKKRRKVALFRGDFNPIHNGQINVVKQTLDAGLVDEIWILPTTKNQFDWASVDNEVRVDMLKLAFADVSNVRLCREELDFLGQSDVHSVLKRLKKKYDHEFILLVGSDLLYEACKWYKYAEIVKENDFIVFERGGFPLKDVPEMNILAILKGSVSHISSAEVRLKRLESQSVFGMVPPEIEKYIKEKYLYTKRTTRVVY